MAEFHFPGMRAAEAADSAPGRYHVALRHGTLELGYYSPIYEDPQSPHTRDEVYVIVSGTGRFEREGRSVRFGPGDALFVAAGEDHRFVEFSDDTQAWVVFYGPEGGEGG